MTCRRCGAPLPADARFCSSCGAPVGDDASAGAVPAALDDRTQMIAGLPEESGSSATSPAPSAPVGGTDPLPPGSALLVVRRGPNAGSRFLLDAPVVTAGRHPDSDILLDDVTVSRRHAEFHRTAAGWELRDAGSLNGTYLNGSRIDAAELASGDEVQIGKFLVAVAAMGSDGPAVQ